MYVTVVVQSNYCIIVKSVITINVVTPHLQYLYESLFDIVQRELIKYVLKSSWLKIGFINVFLYIEAY